MIKFAPGYKKAIKNETKQITIRKGIVNNIFPGGLEETNIGAELLITSIRYCCFGILTIEELEDDGFSSMIDCLSTMKQFYGETNTEDLCTVIRFELVK